MSIAFKKSCLHILKKCGRGKNIRAPHTCFSILMGDFTGNSIRFLASRQITKHAALKHNLLSGGGELLTHHAYTQSLLDSSCTNKK